MIYVKKRIEGSETEFNVVRIEEELQGEYLDSGYELATKEEYLKQFADREAVPTSEADAALGEEDSKLEDHVVTEEDVEMLKDSGIDVIAVGETIQIPVPTEEVEASPASSEVESSEEIQ